MISFAIVSTVPNDRLRRYLNNTASLIGFRIIARSISAVIEFHNEEYKPKNCGFCVANHTSPIDVTILASDCTYSLVSNDDMLWILHAKRCTCRLSLFGHRRLRGSFESNSSYMSIKCFHFLLFHPVHLSTLGLLAYLLYSHSRLYTRQW